MTTADVQNYFVYKDLVLLCASIEFDFTIEEYVC